MTTENTFEVTFRFTAPLDMAKCEQFAERLMDQFPDNVAVSVHQVPDEEPDMRVTTTATFTHEGPREVTDGVNREAAAGSGPTPERSTDEPPGTAGHLYIAHGLMERYLLLLTDDGLEQEHLWQHKRDKAAGITSDHEHESMKLETL